MCAKDCAALSAMWRDALNWAILECVKITLPPGACPTCGGEGQEQYLDANAEEGVAVRTCVECNGTGTYVCPQCGKEH
jgi:uncharacterized protein (UPF0212 family)